MIYQKSRHLMGTEVSITLFDVKSKASDIDVVFDIFSSLEQEFSRFIDTSLLSQINQQRQWKVSKVYKEVFQKAKEIYETTQWYFNPLVSVAQIGYQNDFARQEFHKKEIIIDTTFDKVDIPEDIITLQADQYIDFGGIVKGFAVDQARKYLDSIWYHNYIIDGGGDIYVHGQQENETPVVVGIDSPFDPDTIVATLEISNQAIATSGTYKRKREIDHKPYTHIINPLTNTSTHEIVSISIIWDEAYLMDAYATACIAMGRDKALKFLVDHDIEWVIIDSQKNIYSTPGIAKYHITYY